MELSPSHTWDGSTCAVVSCIVDNLANLKHTKSKLNIAHNFYKNCAKFALVSKQTMHLKDSFIFSRTLISFILLLMSFTSCKISLTLSSTGKFKAGAGGTTQSSVSVLLKLRKFKGALSGLRQFSTTESPLKMT